MPLRSFSLGVLLSFSVFLGNIKEAFDKDPHLKNLLLDDFFKTAIEKCQVSNSICMYCYLLYEHECFTEN